MANVADRYEELYDTYIFLNKTVSMIRRLRHFELYRLGFKSGFTGISYFIAKHGNGMKVSEIASLAHLQPHTVTEIINRMQRAGLVEKEKDSQDKRVVRVKLTEEGLKASTVSSAYRRVINDVLGCLSTDELDQFRSCLERLSDKAQDLGKEIKSKTGRRLDRRASPSPQSLR